MFVVGILRFEIDREHRRFDIFGNVYDFFETWDTKSNGFRSDTGIMESVQSHLGCRFTNGLSGQCATHFSRMGYRSDKSGFDFSDYPFESTAIEMVFL